MTFYSREDHIRLRGWFIPGVLPNGRQTAQRTLIVVHGTGSNRASPLVLSLSSALTQRGFAILAFDLRGMGQSDLAPLSEGYFEQRDVLGLSTFCARDICHIQNWDVRALSQAGETRWERQRCFNCVVDFFTRALGPDTGAAPVR